MIFILQTDLWIKHCVTSNFIVVWCSPYCWCYNSKCCIHCFIFICWKVLIPNIEHRLFIRMHQKSYCNNVSVSLDWPLAPFVLSHLSDWNFLSSKYNCPHLQTLGLQPCCYILCLLTLILDSPQQNPHLVLTFMNCWLHLTLLHLKFISKCKL